MGKNTTVFLLDVAIEPMQTAFTYFALSSTPHRTRAHTRTHTDFAHALTSLPVHAILLYHHSTQPTTSCHQQHIQVYSPLLPTTMPFFSVQHLKTLPPPHSKKESIGPSSLILDIVKSCLLLFLVLS